MARQITEQAVRAFDNNREFHLSNTTVTVDDGVTKMYLFGNLIAKKENNKLYVTLAVYNTPTTRERLNGLSGVSICQRNFTPYLNGKEISSYEFYEV
jgi:hypothetical protein